MTEKHWQRARRREQIEERERAILKAAEELFQSQPYEKVTMQMIARKVEFSQSNLYRYFRTREEIFLRLFVADVDEWVERVDRRFREPLPQEQFADAWTAVILENPRLLRLLPLLAISLEKNASEEVYARTKLALSGQLQTLAAAMGRALPRLTPPELRDLLQLSTSLAAGLRPMAQYTEMQLRVLKEHGLEQIRIDFSGFFKASLITYLKGLTAETRS